LPGRLLEKRLSRRRPPGGVLWVPDDEHEYGLRYLSGCTELRFCGLDQPILKDGAGHALTNTCDECLVLRRRCESFSGILLGVSWFQKKGFLGRIFQDMQVIRLSSSFQYQELSGFIAFSPPHRTTETGSRHRPGWKFL
jgi:hypothetical protein